MIASPLSFQSPPNTNLLSSLGIFLVAGGRSNVLYIWNMKKHVLEHVIQLPPRVKNVQQLLFVPDTFDGNKSQVSLPPFLFCFHHKTTSFYVYYMYSACFIDISNVTTGWLVEVC